MRKRINVMFTAVCGWPTNATVKALRDSNNADYTIIGVDYNPMDGALNYVDYLYKVPAAKDPDYIDEVLKICEKHRVDVIVPLISEEIGAFMEHRARIAEKGIAVLLSAEDSRLDIANDKFKLYNFLSEHGIHVMPKTKMIDLATLEEDLKEFGFPERPVAVKLKDGCGAMGFKILVENMALDIKTVTQRKTRSIPYITKAELMNMPEESVQRYMLQEYLDGDELSTICLVDHGRTVYSPSHYNYEMQHATATLCELVDNQEASAIAAKINELLKLDGNICFDFKMNSAGELKLLECNPRISATVSLAAKAGLNLIEMGVFHALGLPIDEGIVPLYGMRLQRVYGALYSYGGKAYE